MSEVIYKQSIIELIRHYAQYEHGICELLRHVEKMDGLNLPDACTVLAQDCIDRQDAIDTIDRVWSKWDINTVDQFRDELRETFISLPSAGKDVSTWQKGEPMEMAEIKLPIQVNLPDDWVEQIVNRLRKDPEAEWVEIVRCKDCKHMITHEGYGYLGEPAYTCEGNMEGWVLPDSFCSHAERKDGD